MPSRRIIITAPRQQKITPRRYFRASFAVFFVALAAGFGAFAGLIISSGDNAPIPEPLEIAERPQLPEPQEQGPEPVVPESEEEETQEPAEPSVAPV